MAVAAGDTASVIPAIAQFVIRAAFSPRESGEGIHWLAAGAKWIPAWPFLETSPFGLVFAGMTS